MIAAHKTRRGMTLLEIMIASAMLATVMTAVAVVVRSSYASWKAHENDVERIEAAHATVRHIVRNLRQADSVTAITAKTATAGSLTVLMTDGTTLTWARNSSTNEVNHTINSVESLLSENITELSFIGYEQDATTETTTVGDIHAIKCTAKVVLPVESGGDRTVSCWVWIRTW
jgi:prepilin-type N-terminal cleavage/methylation domain-containing protein